ncbi:MAG: hypothetical protein AAGD06_27030 [Acidobacteriota bacterium]
MTSTFRGPEADRADLHALHPDMEPWVDGWLEQRGASWRQLERGDLELPQPPGMRGLTQLQIVQWFVILTDPVAFAETMLLERPENGGGPWRLFEYQRPSLRYHGPVVNQSAAGVGKTREIEILILWGLTCRAGKILVVGNMEGTIDEIWLDVKWQIHKNPWLATQLPADNLKSRPRRRMEARNGNTCLFLPTGDDGEPLRGQHITQFVLGDEVAKWDNPVIFHELYRALEPGCVPRLYSVSTGKTDVEFHKISKRAVPIDDVLFGDVTLEQRDRQRGEALGSNIKWARVQWTKPMMPAPYWSAEREAFFVELYGGKDTDGYKKNVLGLDGDPEGRVFPKARLKAATTSGRPYVFISLTWDDDSGMVLVEVARGPGSAETPLPVVLTAEIPMGNLDLEGFIRTHLQHIEPGTFVGGGDVGFKDATELLLFRVVGLRKLLDVRLRLKHCPYPLQRLAILTVDQMLRVSRGYGWGLDATGVGTAVEQELRPHMEADHLTGFIWNSKLPLLDTSTGEPIVDNQGQERRVTAKEMATQVIEGQLQRYQLVLYEDKTLLDEWRNHTATVTKTGAREFSRFRDHTLDAGRAAVLRWFLLEFGAGTGLPPVTGAVLPAASRHPLGEGLAALRAERSLVGGGRTRIGGVYG